MKDLESALDSIAAARAYVVRAMVHCGHTYALVDAQGLLDDAAGQIRGEMKAQLPEYPLFVQEAV